MTKWAPLAVLGLAQFLMVLDQAVMNVSITQLVSDFDTSVSAIQGVITMYSLVMAMLMITGGKLGDILGRRRTFAIGMAVYGAGSALTAASWSVATLAIGWSVLEGVGAALVLPALVALVAGNYRGRDRVTAYAVIGGNRRSRNRGRTDRGWMGDHRVVVAGRLHRRGRDRPRRPRRSRADPRRRCARRVPVSTGSARC